MSTKEKLQEALDLLELKTGQHEIILHNDEVNTFDFVISSLISVCGHTSQQAEQCTVLVHYKGKCAVKSGSYSYLEPKCLKLQELGLSAELV